MRDHSQTTSLLFVLAIVVFNMLMLQIFIAIIVDAFVQTQNEHVGRAFLTDRQYEWIELQRAASRLQFRAKNIPPSHEPRKSIHRIVTSRPFKRLVGVVIFLYTCVLCSLFANSTPEYDTFFNVSTDVLGAFYVLEAAMQMVAFGIKFYFNRRENVLSFAVCVCVILGWAIPTWKNVLCSIIVLRVLRLLYWSPSALHLLQTLLVFFCCLLFSARSFCLFNDNGLIFFLFFCAKNIERYRFLSC